MNDLKRFVKTVIVTGFCLGLFPLSLVDLVFRRFRWMRGA